MIWGLAIGPGQMFSCILEEEVHLSLAALESRPGQNVEGSKYSQVVLKTKDAEQLICTLVHGTIFQQSLDLKLMPREKVSFSVHGSGVVYITGYSFSSPVEEYTEDEVTPPTGQESTQEADVEREEFISADVSVNIKDEPSQVIQEDSAHFPEMTTEDLAEPSIDTENRKIEVSVSMDETEEEEITHPIAAIAEKEPDFSVASGTSSSMWLDSRVPVYGTEESTEAQTYPPGKSRVGTDRAVADPLQSTVFHGAPQNQAEPKSNSYQGMYPLGFRSINTRDQLLDLPQASTDYQVTRQPSNLSRKKHVMCRFCRTTFASFELKRTHEATHTEHRAYRCLYCTKSFKTHGHREQHERIHTGVKPFKCRICAKGFTQSGDRNRHERIHTVRKTFQCEHCLKSFRNLKYLLVHKRSKHGLISDDTQPVTDVGGDIYAQPLVDPREDT